MPKNVEVGYSKENAQIILNKFKEKGWNLYAYEEGKNSDDIIRENLAETLIRDTNYTLLPAAVNPRNPDNVFAVLHSLAQTIGTDTLPQIEVANRNYSLIGITLKEDEVKIHTEEGDFVSYPDFIEGIDTVIQIN